jgi:hypothetical protein
MKFTHLYNGIFILFGFWISSCEVSTPKSESNLLALSEKVIGRDEYRKIYNNANDSIQTWAINGLSFYRNYIKNTNYYLDSIICFNGDGTRMISCILKINEGPDSNSDGLDYFMGEKIKNKWYFFTSSNHIILPREMVKGQDIHKPLNYTQLHYFAIHEVIGSYLKSNGEINENWFTSHFEGPGWGDLSHQEYNDWCFNGKRYTNLKEYYVAAHLCKVKGNWGSRDTTQPVKQLPAKPNP